MAGKPKDVVYVEQSSGYADRLVKSRTFEVPSIKGRDIPRRPWLFRWPGDLVEGWLRAGPITNVRRNASYIIELVGDQAAGKHGEEVEIFGNQQIHTVIRNNELLGRMLRIQYVGRQLVAHCTHRRKVYRIFEIQGASWLTPAVETEQPGSGGPVESPESDTE